MTKVLGYWIICIEVMVSEGDQAMTLWECWFLFAFIMHPGKWEEHEGLVI